MGYNEGYQQGKQSGGNVFTALLSGINDAQARRLAEDKKRREEERALKDELTKLGIQETYKRELEKTKAEEDRKTEFNKQYLGGGITEDPEGTIEGAFFGHKDKKFKATPKETIVYTLDPVTQELKPVSSVPKGSKVYQEKPTLEEEATKAEVRKIAEVKPNLDRAMSAITELRGLFEKGDVSKSVKKGDVFGGLLERSKGVFEGMTAKAGGNPELQQYLKLRKSFASLITKGGFLEAGVLTNPDIERALGALPTTGSTKEEIELGWKTLENVMTSAQKRFEELKRGKTQSTIKPKITPEQARAELERRKRGG